MANYILLDKPNVPTAKVIKESKHLMTDNKKRYFVFLLSNAHWILLTLVTGFIAGIWTIPYLLSQKAVFYEDLKTDF